MLREWKDMPKWMKCSEVKEYYDILYKKKLSLKIKRVFDIVAAFTMLLLLAIPMIIISIMIKLDSEGPVFYRQERITAYGKKFRIHKFRTMVNNAEKIGTEITVKNDNRITNIGRKIRKLRIDEIPQLIDVLEGNMSFVGTRPEVTKYVKKYTKEMRATLLLPAGITSEASIRYKKEEKLLDVANDVDKVYLERILPVKMKYNLESIKGFSFHKEILTMFRTISVILGKEYSKRSIKTVSKDIKQKRKPLVALFTNNDDDIYCFRKELIEDLLTEGYEILISCPYGPKIDLIKDIPYIYDNPVIDRRGMNIIADGKLFFHYKKLLKREQPDVILTYTAKPNVYASVAARILGIPYINNVTGIGSVVNMTGIKKTFILWLFKFTFKNATYVMFQNSTNMQFALKNGMISGEYKLIPGSGVNLSRYPVQNYPKGGNGKTGEKIVFNYIGRVLHDKGIDDYIEAAKRIKKKYQNTEFNILGFIEPQENHYKKDLFELSKMGIVHYRGSQNDVKPWIARAHAIIHPSTYGEGMSNVLLENASCGRFLITTDNPGCQEIVINGKSGYIYHGGDIDALVQVIETFLSLDNETRKSMGIAGRKHVEDNFSRDIVINAYKQVIKRIVSDKVNE